MSEKVEKFEKDIKHLIAKGEFLHLAMQFDCYGDKFKEGIIKQFGKEETKEFSKNLPDFNMDYQAWYSEAQALIKQVLPHRLNDFISYYEYPRVRKDISFQNYMIRDYLQGLQITSGYEKRVIADKSSAIPEFIQQLNIVKAAHETLDSSLINLTSILQADIFDSEVDSTRALAKAGFLRAAGAICGVVIEKHLKQICENHSVSIRKKNPGISSLIEALKDKDILSVPQWRFIQHLADIRNLCDHAKSKDPSKDEIDDLLSGTEKTLKTVF